MYSIYIYYIYYIYIHGGKTNKSKTILFIDDTTICTVGKQINAKPYYLLTTLLYARWENK